MSWTIERIISYQFDKLWGNGCAHHGFHDKNGMQYVVCCKDNWVGCLGENDELFWTAGPVPIETSLRHIKLDLESPNHICFISDRSLLLSSNGNKKIYRICTDTGEASIFIDASQYGFEFIGACEYDLYGNIWVSDTIRGLVLQFDSTGKYIRTLGHGEKSFQEGTVSFDDVTFNLINSIKCGSDGNTYVLDSKNFAVRMIDPISQTVKLIAGTGKSGYFGDGGDPLLATFGSSLRAQNGFDGPWYLTLDEECNIYIADTQNHVVRMINKKDNLITTIAGSKIVKRRQRNDPNETDVFKLNLPTISSLDYSNGRLFIPEWDGDLVVLTKSGES